MKVSKNWVRTPDGKTHGIKEGNSLKVTANSASYFHCEVWKDYGLVGKLYHGIPILLLEKVSENIMKLEIKLEGEILSGRRYLLRTIGVDKDGKLFEDYDVFEIFSDE